LKAFLDTSVLVASFYGEHQHHEASFALFLRQNKSSGCTAAHCLLEVYSVVTGMPGKDRASPDDALRFLQDVRERLSIIALDEKEYFKMLESLPPIGISGGSADDALIGHCALRAKSEFIYTWNVKHFTRLGPLIAPRVRTP